MSKWTDDEKVQRARAMLHGLCEGSKKFTMSVPVRLDDDSDMVLSDGLNVAEQRGRRIINLEAELAAMRPVVEAAEKWCDAWSPGLLDATLALNNAVDAYRAQKEGK